MVKIAYLWFKHHVKIPKAIFCLFLIQDCLDFLFLEEYMRDVLHHLYVRTWCPYVCLSNTCRSSINIMSLMNCLCPFQPKKRVYKWTHEPRSILNHKKHLTNTIITLYILCNLLFRKYKNTFFTCKHTQNPKTNIIYCYCISCLVLFILL